MAGYGWVWLGMAGYQKIEIAHCICIYTICKKTEIINVLDSPFGNILYIYLSQNEQTVILAGGQNDHCTLYALGFALYSGNTVRRCPVEHLRQPARPANRSRHPYLLGGEIRIQLRYAGGTADISF